MTNSLIAMIKEYFGYFADKLRNKKATFVLVIATTDVSLIPGITIAGASPEFTHFTPAADAEFLVTGRVYSMNSIPVSPTGLPSPVVLARAANELLNFPVLVADAGSRVKPRIPLIDLGGEPGKDIRVGAVRKEVAEEVLRRSELLGKELSKATDLLLIGESVPGGTTTAMALLQALGYDALGKTSSASPDNPKDLKVRIVNEALRNLGNVSSPLEVAAKVSDPMLIAVAGLVNGFRKDVLLCGGTQMIAAAALIKAMYGNEALSRIAIGTTRWVVEDPTADALGLAKQVGVRVLSAQLEFSKSRYEGLRMYDKYYVKEGVGAGGLAVTAMANGYDKDVILAKTEEIYSGLVNRA